MMKFLKRNYNYIIFSFFMVSIGSWFLEILFSLILKEKIVFPGTLSGPWCPIYGTTFLFLLLFIRKKDSKILNFIKVFVIATLIEYISSYISGEIFHHVIWDYTGYFLNINGRVCFEMSMLFGIMGYLMIYFIEPFLRRYYLKLGRKVTKINFLFLILFISDILVNIFLV